MYEFLSDTIFDVCQTDPDIISHTLSQQTGCCSDMCSLALSSLICCCMCTNFASAAYCACFISLRSCVINLAYINVWPIIHLKHHLVECGISRSCLKTAAIMKML